MSGMPELLLCPFCGKEPARNTPYRWAMCCGAALSFDKWNTRSDSTVSALRAELEEMRRFVRMVAGMNIPEGWPDEQVVGELAAFFNRGSTITAGDVRAARALTEDRE